MFVAESTPYSFCRKCKHTMYEGKIRGFKDCPEGCECKPCDHDMRPLIVGRAEPVMICSKCKAVDQQRGKL